MSKLEEAKQNLKKIKASEFSTIRRSCIAVKPQFRTILRRRPEKITLTAKWDELIIRYKMKVFEKYGTDPDQAEHISAKIGEMGRLLLQLISKGFACLRESLLPKHFDCVVQAVKDV